MDRPEEIIQPELSSTMSRYGRRGTCRKTMKRMSGNDILIHAAELASAAGCLTGREAFLSPEYEA